MSKKPSNAQMIAAAHGVGSIITWVIQKKTPTATIGLTFRSRNKRVIIDKVRGRASRKTDLVPGLRVLKVCGHDVTSASQCVEHIHSAPVGGIFIVTEGKHRANTKKNKKEKAGISIQKWPNQEYVQLARVNPVGMFRDLKVGQVLFIINGVKIHSVMQALRLLRKKRKLRIVTVDVTTAVDPFDLIGENVKGGNAMESEQFGATEPDGYDDGSDAEENADVDDIGDDESDKFSQSDADSRMSSSNWDGQSTGEETSSSQWSSIYGDDKGPGAEEGDDGMLPTGLMEDVANQWMPTEIQMVTTRVISSVIKPTQETSLGIKFALKFDQHYVEKIERNGLFAECKEIALGQRLISVKIGNTPSPTIEDGVMALKGASGRITIETTDGDFNAGDEIANNLKERLVVHFQKPENKGRLGVGFQKKAEGICVVGVANEGYLAELGALSVGDKVVGFDGAPCPTSTEELVGAIVAAEDFVSLELSPAAQKNGKDAAADLAKAEKEKKRKEIEVLTPELGPTVVAEVEKPKKNCKVGISLRKSLKIDSILIAAIADDGLLKESELRVGQKIISINNVPCPTNTISAIKLIKGTPPGKLRLEASEVDWSATLAKTAGAAPTPAPAAADGPATKKGEGEEEGDEIQGLLDDFEAQLQNAYNDLNLDYDSADSSAVGDDQSFASGLGSNYMEHGK